MAGDQRLGGARLGQSGEGEALEDAVAHHQQAFAREEPCHRIEEQPAQLGELAAGGGLGPAAAPAPGAGGVLDLGAPGEHESLQGIGRDGPQEAPPLAQPVLQQQGVAVEQALDLGGLRGPRLGQGGVAGIAGPQTGPHPIEILPTAPEFPLDRPQLLQGGGRVQAQAGLAGDQRFDLPLDLLLAGAELRVSAAPAEVRAARNVVGEPVEQRAR